MEDPGTDQSQAVHGDQTGRLSSGAAGSTRGAGAAFAMDVKAAPKIAQARTVSSTREAIKQLQDAGGLETGKDFPRSRYPE